MNDKLRNLQDKKLIPLSERKKIMINILLEIEEFCKLHNLSYFLIGGTLIGAIRHNGFIPWDDDIDIGLPRNDYDFLINNFKLKKDVHIISPLQENMLFPFSKAININTILIENNDIKHSTGVFVDIFPLDYVGNTYTEAEKNMKKVQFYQKLLTIKHLKFSKNRGFIKNCIVLFSKIFYLIPNKWFKRKIFKITCKCSYKKETNYIANLYGAWGIREITNSNNFKNTIKHRFEEYDFPIPNGYDDYLKGIYGNYMELPPKEKQITHHNSVAYWK